MNRIALFLAYADAFEVTYEDDNWQRIEEYFTEDAEYDGAVGRDAVLEKLRTAITTLDRQMDSRDLSLQPPREEGDSVIVDWSVRFSKAGCPELVIGGRETATYDGDRISRLHDDIDAESMQRFEGWMAEHGGKLSAQESHQDR